MEKILDKAIEFFVDTFDKHWVNVCIVLGGIAAVFILGLILSRCSDFARNKKACDDIAEGRIDEGMLRFRRTVAHRGGSSETAPDPRCFDYDKIIIRPYLYSKIKRLPLVIMTATVFFATAGVSLAVFLEGFFTVYAAFSLVAATALGFVLYFLASVIAASSLKSGTKKYDAMIEFLKKEKSTDVQAAQPETIQSAPAAVSAPAPAAAPVSAPAPAPVSAIYTAPAVQPEAKRENEKPPLSNSAAELVQKINGFSKEGGATLMTLKMLSRQLDYEKGAPENRNSQAAQLLNDASVSLDKQMDAFKK